MCSPFTSANICSSMAPCSPSAAAMFQYVVTMRYGALVLPRYTVRISSALAGANCSRNQARAFRMTGSRRRSYSLSSRSALSYLVVTGGSVMAVARKLRGLFAGGDPGAPRLLRRADAQLLLMANQRHAEQQRLQGQFLEPALLREQRRREAQLREALGVAVDQGADTELLGEAAQLAGRGGPLVEIHEVGLDPTLGKETQRGAGVGALPDTEDLHFHTSCRWRTARRPARRAPAAWLRASPPGARPPRRAARACASRRRGLPRRRCRRRSSPRPRAHAAIARPAAGSAARARAAPRSRARAAWAAPRGGRIAGPAAPFPPPFREGTAPRSPLPRSDHHPAKLGDQLPPTSSLLRTAADRRGTESGRAPRRGVPRPAGRPPAPSPGCPALRSAAAGRTHRL